MSAQPSPADIEALARALCLRYCGRDPDQRVTPRPPTAIQTAQGPVYLIPSETFPLWRYFAGVAGAALGLARDAEFDARAADDEVRGD